jgi:hypothetical protein
LADDLASLPGELGVLVPEGARFDLRDLARAAEELAARQIDPESGPTDYVGDPNAYPVLRRVGGGPDLSQLQFDGEGAARRLANDWRRGLAEGRAVEQGQGGRDP